MSLIIWISVRGHRLIDKLRLGTRTIITDEKKSDQSLMPSIESDLSSLAYLFIVRALLVVVLDGGVLFERLVDIQPMIVLIVVVDNAFGFHRGTYLIGKVERRGERRRKGSRQSNGERLKTTKVSFTWMNQCVIGDANDNPRKRGNSIGMSRTRRHGHARVRFSYDVAVRWWWTKRTHTTRTDVPVENEAPIAFA